MIGFSQNAIAVRIFLQKIGFPQKLLNFGEMEVW
jgi:hypothetical protein